MSIPVALIWVCFDCMITRESESSQYDDVTGEYAQPWSKIEDGYSVTFGIIVDNDAHDGANMEHIDFSTSPCDGCGSKLHGERHAYTLWDDRVEMEEIAV